MRKDILPIALLAVAAACGGSDDGLDMNDDDLNDDDHPPTACKITLSGELSGTYGCQAAAGRDPEAEGSIIGAVGLNLGGNVKMITIAAEIPSGDPVIRSYAPADFSTAGVIVQTNDNRFFMATHGANQGDHGALGAFRLTGIEAFPGTEGGKAWTIHGSFSAELADVVTQKKTHLTVTF